LVAVILHGTFGGTHPKVNFGLREGDISLTSCAFAIRQSHTEIANLPMMLLAGAAAYPI
jgi:hypothetical protein